MNQIISFLNGLDDYELAYFAKFKIQTYSPETQLEINRHLRGKGLAEDRINRLIAANPKKEAKKGKVRCPRCSSDKIRTEKVTFKNQMICNVCEYWIEKPNSEKRKKSIWYHIYDTIFHLFTS
ncbi:MAG: hypothetical protein CMC07_04300 [Flavobacteriaceae bacterium]|nr:hypothetical protein [Flavobacteriaceae bacterium]|tara:strand:+ start:25671 stop:26039 length:369 start_codon:yes stop_codon:yes gene_type:complete